MRDRFICARDENVKDRQRASELLRFQVDFHVSRDEKAVIERGVHRVFEILQRARVGDAGSSGGPIDLPARTYRCVEKLIETENQDL